jgi:hypothetical protein
VPSRVPGRAGQVTEYTGMYIQIFARRMWTTSCSHARMLIVPDWQSIAVGPRSSWLDFVPSGPMERSGQPKTAESQMVHFY